MDHAGGRRWLASLFGSLFSGSARRVTPQAAPRKASDVRRVLLRASGPAWLRILPRRSLFAGGLALMLAGVAAKAADATDLYLPIRLQEGVWDADVVFFDGEKETGRAKGVQTNVRLLNGHWITNDFQIPQTGQLPAYQGHGVWGFDPVAKTYVNTWVDTNDRTVRIDYGFWYAKEQTMAWSSKQSDGEGHFLDYRMTEEFKGDTRIFTVHQLALVKPNPYLLLRITFTKRKP